eukprot:9940611-Alexandrium_andersonii.AAC.1
MPHGAPRGRDESGRGTCRNADRHMSPRPEMQWVKSMPLKTPSGGLGRRRHRAARNTTTCTCSQDAAHA